MRLNIRTRLLLGFGAVLCFTAAMGGAGWFFMGEIAGVNARLTESLEDREIVHKMGASLRGMFKEEMTHLLDPEEGHIRYEEEKKEFEDWMRLWSKIAHEERAGKDRIFESLYNDYMTSSENVDRLLHAGRIDEARRWNLTSTTPLFNRMLQFLEEEEEIEGDETAGAIKTAADTVNLNRSAILFFTASALISGLALSFFISGSVSKPVRKLRDAVLEVGEGNLDAAVEIRSKDEIGDLAASLNKMTNNLKEITVSRDDLAVEVEKRKKAEEELKRAYAESREKSEYLERFNRLMVGREHEMVRLKAEVNELLERAGQAKKYEAPEKVKEKKADSSLRSE